MKTFIDTEIFLLPISCINFEGILACDLYWLLFLNKVPEKVTTNVLKVYLK